MRFSTIVTVGAALLQSSYAKPINPFEGALSKRSVDKLPPGDEFVECPNYSYSRGLIEAAIQQGIITTPTSEPQPGGFPHRFGNNRKLNFPNCNGRELWEFPILNTNRGVYGGGDPGANRVVFAIQSKNPDTDPTRDGIYCGVMTHDGAPQGEFNLCIEQSTDTLTQKPDAPA